MLDGRFPCALVSQIGLRRAEAMAGERERPPLPPFETEADALRKVKIAEQAWNTRDPKRVSLGYTPGEASPVPQKRGSEDHTAYACCMQQALAEPRAPSLLAVALHTHTSVQYLVRVITCVYSALVCQTGHTPARLLNITGAASLLSDWCVG